MQTSGDQRREIAASYSVVIVTRAMAGLIQYSRGSSD